ncbi:MAG: hypothetical protein ACYDEX_03245 [Mobilitalea sp.]
MKDEAMKNSRLSVLSITLTMVFSTIVHAMKYGAPAIVMGAVFLLVVYAIVFLYMKTSSKLMVIFYGLINTVIILGHGIYNGFWNHFMKVSLYYLHNQQLPQVFANLFTEPTLGSGLYETFGILAFFASIVAAYYTYKTVQHYTRSLNDE